MKCGQISPDVILRSFLLSDLEITVFRKRKKVKNNSIDLWGSLCSLMLILRVSLLRHGASRRGRCLAMRYVVHGPSWSTSRPRSLFNRSLYGALNTGNFSLMRAIRSIESPRAPTFPLFSERTIGSS